MESTSNGINITDWLPSIVAIIAIVFSYLQFRRSVNSTIKAKAIEDERKEIYAKLNEFYGPLMQLRRQSELLYRKFSGKYKLTDPNFRTVNYLLDGHKFTDTESEILNEIIRIGKQCEDLIISKSGLIDDNELGLKVIPKYTRHALILRLAKEGKITGNPEDFEDCTFPREFDKLLSNRVESLQKRLEQLNQGKM